MTLDNVLKEKKPSLTQGAKLILKLSLPGILAELTSIAMQYIDAAMVGSLGANATGAIGLVSTSTWLMGGACIGLGAGFYVQAAQLVGAGENEKASSVLRQSLKFAVILGILIATIGALLSNPLPRWLHGEEAVLADASSYFLIYSLALPFMIFSQLSGGMMQASGDMKTPSKLSALVCILDVVFNFLFIFPTRTIAIGSFSFTMWGAGLGVTGAALGTAVAELIVAVLEVYFVCFKNEKLAINKHKGSWKWSKDTILKALKISIPMTADHVFMCSAYVVGTLIISPIGTVAVAANSLAVTAESLCYMPGYGISSAATAIIGQTIGADRKDLTRSFSRLSVALGMILMGVMAVLMYFLAPYAFAFLTSDPEVAALGTSVLRLELIAEPLYGASIVCSGVFRGAGDTLRPSILNLISMWGVRIVLAYFLVPVMGLSGYWLAMAIELCFRGTIFLIRLFRNKWMKPKVV